MHPDGLTHKEKFRDEDIVIPAKKYVLMDYEDAILFKSQFSPIKTDAMGQHDRSSFKVIKIEQDKADGTEPIFVKKWICQMDGREFPNQDELLAYTEARYGDQTFTDDSLEANLVKAPIVEEKKRGRPFKDKTA